MLANVLTKKLATVDCEVRGDNLTRQLYATDASIYQVEPCGVAFPRHAAGAAQVIRRAGDAGLTLIPRGGGSGLAGGAIGSGLVLDFARHNRRIGPLDLERDRVRVEPGVVLDQLNAFLRPYGRCFGPDVATSSRATLGGMIANNSSGSHVPVYGTTADHVLSLDVILADGSWKRVTDGGAEGWPEAADRIGTWIESAAGAIEERMPEGLLKRWPGYGVDRWLRRGRRLTDVLAGSEGTLAAIVGAELKVVPLPEEKGLGLIFFASVAEAMEAAVELADLHPAAVEHVDRILFDQTRGQLAFRAARDLMELDARPCESILLVEFFGDVADRLEALSKKGLGMRTKVVRGAQEMQLVWGLRKAGLSLLTGRPGPAKPTTGIEDAAILPRHLPEYVASLRGVLSRLNLEACFYGHAASGLLHVRPVLDLHREEDRQKLRQVADEVSSLVRQFKGSLAAEHGVGLARTAYMREHLGGEIWEVMRRIKRLFDPHGRFNPGKIFGDDTQRIDSCLRVDTAGNRPMEEPARLLYVPKQETFIGNLEQCNGNGGCRKESPMMCPTYIATGEEIMSTRGRANALRAALEGRRTNEGEWWDAPEVDEALRYCLACKGCTTECPSNVNMTMLKAETLQARHEARGLSVRERMIGGVDWVGAAGCLAPGWANAVMATRVWRRGMEKVFGFASARPLPAFAGERFDVWFWQRPAPARRGWRGRLILWDDTFVRYYEPEIGRAAVAVMEAAGYEVHLMSGRVCCGRPSFSQGWLDRAARLGRHNLGLVQGSKWGDCPIIFLEPSCWSMFVEDYASLRLPGAEEVAGRCYLFERFMEDLLCREPEAVVWARPQKPALIHAHCHAKSIEASAYMGALASRVVEGQGKAEVLPTGCCGMAGSFGAMAETYDLSLRVAAPLVRHVENRPDGTVLIASGTSCRHQIEHLTSARPWHMAEYLAAAMGERGSEV